MSATARTRKVGATAVLKQTGGPVATSDTGGVLDVVAGVSPTGFSPVDLLYASLASCLVLSLRIAATRKGIADKLDEVRVHVTGDKAEEGPSRVARFHVRFVISGGIDQAARRDLIAAAEEICTVSNTLRGEVEFLFAID
ncbi:MAG: OsmC family protein [Methylobacteriaceae bacterium]|nr:OsmC family protein [Methylobacteriaceae bacterium]